MNLDDAYSGRIRLMVDAAAVLNQQMTALEPPKPRPNVLQRFLLRLAERVGRGQVGF